MKLLLLNVSPADRVRMLNCIDIGEIKRLEVVSGQYSGGTPEKADHMQPDLIIFDSSKIEEEREEVYASLCARFSFADIVALDDAPVLPAEQVVALPIRGYLQKPLERQACKKVLCPILHRDGKWIAGEEAPGKIHFRNVWGVFNHYQLITGLLSGGMHPAVTEKVCELLDIGKEEQWHYHVFVVRVKNGKRDLLPDNFGIFAQIQNNILAKHLVVCTSPTELVGLVACKTPSALPVQGMEWKVMQRWLLSRQAIAKDLYITRGPWVDTLSSIQHSYQCAVVGTRQAFFTGYRTMFYNELCTLREETLENADELVKQFVTLLYRQDKAGALAHLQMVYGHMQQYTVHHIGAIQRLYSRMLYALRHTKSKLTQEKLSQSEELYEMWNEVTAKETLEELHDDVCGKTEQLFKEIHIDTQCSRATMRIIHYIHTNYRDTNLSLQTIADGVYMTPTYISAVFKKETGITVGQYVKTLRIEHSKVLLSNPQNTLQQIADEVGFLHASHYSKIFKKYVGLLPSEYRSSATKQFA